MVMRIIRQTINEQNLIIGSSVIKHNADRQMFEKLRNKANQIAAWSYCGMRKTTHYKNMFRVVTLTGNEFIFTLKK